MSSCRHSPGVHAGLVLALLLSIEHAPLLPSRASFLRPSLLIAFTCSLLYTIPYDLLASCDLLRMPSFSNNFQCSSWLLTQSYYVRRYTPFPRPIQYLKSFNTLYLPSSQRKSSPSCKCLRTVLYGLKASPVDDGGRIDAWWQFACKHPPRNPKECSGNVDDSSICD
jgi:hypothetical protein